MVDWEDILYLVLLICTILIGPYMKSIVNNKESRRNLSTLIGFGMILITSGYHIFHSIFSIIINWLIIKLCSRRYIHIYSFSFSFLYLLFFRTTFYFGIPYPPSITNLVQMILTLKLVGLAFELHDSSVAIANISNCELEAKFVPEPSFSEIFHYSFCYIGVLTGPYFSYRVYRDMWTTPFSDYAPCKEVTLNRLMYVPLYAIAFLIVTTTYPLSYARTEEFYEKETWIYRLLYTIPSFIIFRLRMYIGLRLAECGFTSAGLGAYPTSTKPKSGSGPTENFELLISLSKDEHRSKMVEYSFDTIYNIEPKGAEFETTVRSCMKYWNMTIQFWLAAYVYHRFPIKKYRMLVTFMISSFWHGIYAGHYMCLCSVPFYLPIEDVYANYFRCLKLSPIMTKIGVSLAYCWRMFLMGYWGMAFLLLDANIAFKFWYSVYFLPTIITIFMFLFSKYFLRQYVKRPIIKNE